MQYNVNINGVLILFYIVVEVPMVDEPTVVLDCYDFPPAFKTHHLHDIFRSYEGVRGGYKIKWLSDTRALIIFDHPSTGKSTHILCAFRCIY